MDAFARSFLLLFAQLAVGGYAALAVPPFHEIERGFFKSSAAIYLGAAAAAVAGEVALALRATEVGPRRWFEMAAMGVFTGAAASYVASLWSERPVWRARVFTATLFCGVFALSVRAQGYRLAGAFSLESFVYPIAFGLSALVLGFATAGMMLGHWYLVEPGLSVEPLLRVLRGFLAAVTAQVAFAALFLPILWLGGAPATHERVITLFAEQRALLMVRVALGPAAATVLAAMIGRTLRIPQTMAATGLFYMATLAAFVGEMLGRFLLFRTSLPL